MANQLPRLLYVGDVAIEPTTGGETLLHRLLESYPRDRLRVVIGNMGGHRVAPEHVLQGVPFSYEVEVQTRLLCTRFGSHYFRWLMRSAGGRKRRLRGMIAEFRPEAILSVTHGLAWITAAAVAASRKLPLHLILHDDWAELLGDRADSWARDSFGRIYRQAASRLCVCPGMEEEYRRRYGVSGTVLYPGRSANAIAFDDPPERLGMNQTPLVVVYAGMVHLPGYAEGIAATALAIAPLGGKVVVYSNLKERDRERMRLLENNVELRPMIPSCEVINRLRQEAVGVVCPMAFEPGMKSRMEMCFPSKLTEYTAAGLPLLIIGPPQASAVRWARENPAAAIAVESLDQVVKAVQQLADPARRMELARGAIEAGRRYFSYERARRTFLEAIGQSAAVEQ